MLGLMCQWKCWSDAYEDSAGADASAAFVTCVGAATVAGAGAAARFELNKLVDVLVVEGKFCCCSVVF